MNDRKKPDPNIFWETVNKTLKLIGLTIAVTIIVIATIAGGMDASLSQRSICLIVGICSIKYLKESFVKLDLFY